MTYLYFIILLLIALGVLFFLYRRARRERDSLRQAMSRLERELHAQAFDEDQVSHRLAAVGAASAEAILICKIDRTVIYMNPVAQTIFTIPGDNPSLIAVTRRHEIDLLFDEALAGRAADKQIFLNSRTFNVRAVTFDGGVVITLGDITELQRLGRARRDFIANLSHELRTPLTGIRLILDTLKTPAGRKPDLLPTLVDKIVVETESLSQIAQELLDLSSIESGQTVMKMQSSAVKPVATNVVGRLQETWTRKGQKVSVEIDDALQAVMDAPQIERVLLNLLHNAIKFTPQDGDIRIRAQEHNQDEVMIEVADNGGGVSREDLPRIFERFYRGDRARATQGTGLGLAVAKHIVEAHGGKIWAESDGIPGHGSAFRFTLPLASG
jgi:two-component system phosphate regulon sensor histidine kinase PhoR